MADRAAGAVATGPRDIALSTMMTNDPNDRLETANLISLKNWGEPAALERGGVTRNATVDCGWGRVLFGQTFTSHERLVDCLLSERAGERDVAFYVHEPHVAVAVAPQHLFFDPSNAFRLQLSTWGVDDDAGAGQPPVHVRDAEPGDLAEINRIYATRNMVPIRDGYLRELESKRAVSVIVAHTPAEPGRLSGVVIGIDHATAFNDPDNGSSLWSLAVDPLAMQPGVGRILVTALARRFKTSGRSFMDLSVMHDNEEAIRLYDQLGFRQVPVYCVKKKNPINERLYIGLNADEEPLNVYADIIVTEARRRGIRVDVEDADAGLFKLTLGGRTVSCRESLSDFTSGVAMSRCDNKRLTNRLLRNVGLDTPDQRLVDSTISIREFLAEHPAVVVKPVSGEQGRGVHVDLRKFEEVQLAVDTVRGFGQEVIIEEYAEGQDLRIVVIDGEIVAAALRRPPVIQGDGVLDIETLIRKQSRRRAAATQGESSIPIDGETNRCVRAAGFEMPDVLPAGENLTVRHTANLHTGGTLHDVTDQLHPTLRDAGVKAAATLEIPVVGLDFIVASPSQSQYTIIEANERPGLANHEPRPTAQRFVDMLFPETRSARTRTL